MAYKYFNDKRYLESAKRSANYLENEIISKSDYFFLLLWMLIVRIRKLLFKRLQLLIILL